MKTVDWHHGDKPYKLDLTNEKVIIRVKGDVKNSKSAKKLIEVPPNERNEHVIQHVVLGENFKQKNNKDKYTTVE